MTMKPVREGRGQRSAMECRTEADGSPGMADRDKCRAASTKSSRSRERWCRRAITARSSPTVLLGMQAPAEFYAAWLV